jgi:putative Holliday junction resolvase
VSAKARTLLGFDFGKKRIGVAIGQEVTGTARELAVLTSRDERPDWEGITALIAQWRPDALVVGIPVHMDGTEQELTLAARRFGNRLAGRYNLPVYPVDERLSSYEAEQSLIEQFGSRYDKGDIDKRAAQLILQSWLQQQTKNDR